MRSVGKQKRLNKNEKKRFRMETEREKKMKQIRCGIKNEFEGRKRRIET